MSLDSQVLLDYNMNSNLLVGFLSEECETILHLSITASLSTLLVLLCNKNEFSELTALFCLLSVW